MYDATADPACYPDSNVLRNIPDLRSQTDLDLFEADATGKRFIQPFPTGRFSISHYKAVHHHIFQDVYDWAGRFRDVRISKATSMFCFPELIHKNMRLIFQELKQREYLCDLELSVFAAGAAHFLADLNAIHPFRDGNGRSQLQFLSMLADHAGYPLDIAGRLNREAFLAAMISSFNGQEGELAQQIEVLII